MKKYCQVLLLPVALYFLFILSSCSGGTEAPPAEPLKIITERLPNASYGQEYYCALAASGGYQPYKWEVSGQLPKGIKFNPATGSFGGKPGPDAETSTFDIKLYDSFKKENKAPVGKRFTITIQSGPFIASEKDLLPLRILTKTLTDGEVTSPYSTFVAATGGIPPYKWQITGTLPQGITFDPATGQLSGTPTVNGKWKVSFKVSDLLGKTTEGTQPVDLIIKPKALLRGEGFPAFRIISDKLPAAVTGKLYSAFLSATGGISPYLWRIESPLPEGLEFDPESGEIFGTPSVSGMYNLTFSAKDSKSLTTSSKTTIKFEVLPPAVNRMYPLKMVTDALPQAEEGKNYTAALSAQGGVMPYRWTSLTPMPPGLKLKSGTGVISGVPAETGTFTIKMELSDSKTPPSAAWRTFTLEVIQSGGSGWFLWVLLIISLGFGGYIFKKYSDMKKNEAKPADIPPLLISTERLPKAREGEVYAAPLLAAGGRPPYIFEAVGELPKGFTIERDAGIISGKPPYAAPGGHEIKIKVYDGNIPPEEAEAVFTLDILPGMVEIGKKAITIVAKDDKLFFEEFPPGSGVKKLLDNHDLDKEGNEFALMVKKIAKENDLRAAFYVIYCQTAHSGSIETSLKAATIAKNAGVQFYNMLKNE